MDVEELVVLVPSAQVVLGLSVLVVLAVLLVLCVLVVLGHGVLVELVVLVFGVLSFFEGCTKVCWL